MSKTARIARLEGPGKLVWVEEELPPVPPAGFHRCVTEVTAISPGTELAAWTGAPPLRPGPVYPRVNGYCNVARVIQSGENTSVASAGDRVLSFTSHRSHFDLSDADVLAVVPDELPSEAACVAYLYHLGYNAVLRAEVRLGARVLVLGLGVLGIAAVSMARLAGADVAAISNQAALQNMALQAGACWAGSREAFSAPGIWPSRQGVQEGADVVIVTTGSWADWRIALEAATMRGTIVVLGFPGRGTEGPAENPLDPQHFYLKQLRIESVGMSPELADSRGFLRYNERANIHFILGQMLSGKLKYIDFTRYSAPAADLPQVYNQLGSRMGQQLTYLLRWQ